jgi:hypothetical protein
VRSVVSAAFRPVEKYGSTAGEVVPQPVGDRREAAAKQ